MKSSLPVTRTEVHLNHDVITWLSLVALKNGSCLHLKRVLQNNVADKLTEDGTIVGS